MNYPIFSTLLLFLLLSQIIRAQEWEELNEQDVFGGESTVISDLGDLAAGFLVQKGMFESTEAPFPADFERGTYEYRDRTYERQTTPTVTYYRYNFTLTELGSPLTVDSTVVISYNPSDSNFIVIDYHYNIDGNDIESENEWETGAETEQFFDYETSLIDARTLTGDRELANILTDSFNSMIADHIEQDELPDAQYTIQDVYSARVSQFDGDKANEIVFLDDGESFVPYPAYKDYEIYLKAKNSQEKYYLIVMDIYYSKENGEFVLNESRTGGEVLLYESR